MKKQNLKVLKEYSIPFDLELPEEYFQDAQRVLNYHYLGDEQCNHYSITVNAPRAERGVDNQANQANYPLDVR